MRYVEAQGLRTSVIGLGAWQFGSPEWCWGDGFGPAEAQAIVDRARRLGVTMIDTAEIYGRGDSERVLGRILAPRDLRDAFVLASKVTPTWPTRDRVKAAAHATLARMRALQAGGLARNLLFSEENLRRAAPVLDALREVAAAHETSPAQIALAWAIHRPNVVAIPGAKSVAQLESNAAAAEIVLGDDEFVHLNQAADRFHRDTLVSVSAMVSGRARSLLRRR